MKWSWKPKWFRMPETSNNNGKRVDPEHIKAENTRRDAQRKLRNAIAERKEVQEVIKEAKSLSDKFGEAVEQAMRRAANG